MREQDLRFQRRRWEKPAKQTKPRLHPRCAWKCDLIAHPDSKRQRRAKNNALALRQFYKLKNGLGRGDDCNQQKK